MSKQELELIEEKFRGMAALMNAHFENLEDRLERIEEQTTKTNGRVTELEKKELTHIQSCPVAPKVEKINDDLAEYKMFKKYPKMGVAIIAFSVLVFIAATFASIEKTKKAYSEENAQIVKEVIQEINKSLPDTLHIF